jgi:hypothetical protein
MGVLNLRSSPRPPDLVNLADVLVRLTMAGRDPMNRRM